MIYIDFNDIFFVIPSDLQGLMAGVYTTCSIYIGFVNKLIVFCLYWVRI